MLLQAKVLMYRNKNLARRMAHLHDVIERLCADGCELVPALMWCKLHGLVVIKEVDSLDNFMRVSGKE